ncbi:hypothetical protein OCU04_005406 [Sclerotinia nivalis]|uniref:SDR family NAD(P)-dependent oxidoreductase n=1 Tax=Sclerotinia nivalis TaxID=352851 RepID=A0A9X0DLS5_9HELO|nr:hypothetical protein OCU04_005406 [Sclerotinia nivalis]
MNSKTTNGFALITGAASGIGKNATLSIAESGAAGILFADINEKGAEESAIESKKYASNPAYRAIFTRVDITENSVQATAIQEFGRIDYNVNSAGVRISNPENR